MEYMDYLDSHYVTMFPPKEECERHGTDRHTLHWKAIHSNRHTIKPRQIQICRTFSPHRWDLVWVLLIVLMGLLMFGVFVYLEQFIARTNTVKGLSTSYSESLLSCVD